jgi:hypothetical protein
MLRLLVAGLEWRRSVIEQAGGGYIRFASKTGIDVCSLNLIQPATSVSATVLSSWTSLVWVSKSEAHSVSSNRAPRHSFLESRRHGYLFALRSKNKG